MKKWSPGKSQQVMAAVVCLSRPSRRPRGASLSCVPPKTVIRTLLKPPGRVAISLNQLLAAIRHATFYDVIGVKSVPRNWLVNRLDLSYLAKVATS